MSKSENSAENFSTSYVKPLSLIPDQEDIDLHLKNSCPVLITHRLRQLVPLLDFVDCVVSEVHAQRTVLTLPLLESAMNQNGTHQASIFYLVADYALGVGMFAALPGVYVTGVHDCCNALPVQYWLKQGFVKHLAPGTGKLTAEVHINSQEAFYLRTQLIANGRCEYSGSVLFYQNGNQIAEVKHTMGLYANLPRSEGVKANIFQLQNLKTASLMYAGLRDDSISKQIALGQGEAIAKRVKRAVPRLEALVKARTLHVERYLQDKGSHFGQVVVFGAGFDPKPVQYANSNQRWFGIDLRDMLKERDQQFNRINIKEEHFTPVIGDIRCSTWDYALKKAGFSVYIPTLVIIEGLLMHIGQNEFVTILRKFHELNALAVNRIWCDHFSTGMFKSPDEDIKDFISSMSRLTEPLAGGFDDLQTFMPDAWITAENASAEDVLGIADPVYRAYRFSILKPANAYKEAYSECVNTDWNNSQFA
jgi:O-methyltransferase involved in polyketide biosynthesis